MAGLPFQRPVRRWILWKRLILWRMLLFFSKILFICISLKSSLTALLHRTPCVNAWSICYLTALHWLSNEKLACSWQLWIPIWQNGSDRIGVDWNLKTFCVVFVFLTQFWIKWLPGNLVSRSQLVFLFITLALCGRFANVASNCGVWTKQQTEWEVMAKQIYI